METESEGGARPGHRACDPVLLVPGSHTWLTLGRPQEGHLLKGSPEQIEARAGEPGVLVGQEEKATPKSRLLIST